MTTPADSQGPQPDNALTVMKLAVAQIQAAQSDNDAAMLALAQAHQHIACQLSSIAAELTTGIDNIISPSTHDPNAINSHLGRMTIAFQENDALNQRLTHVCRSLELLAQRLGQLEISDDKLGLLAQIEADYTMRRERAVFEAVVNGNNDALTNHAPDSDALSDDSADIELF